MPMKISGSLERKFKEQEENALALQKLLKERILSWCSEHGWFYDDRIKKDESYAQKIEQPRNSSIDDVYAGTIIVRNKLEIEECCQRLEQGEIFGIELQYKRPVDLNKASLLSADKFTFDSARMYFKASKPDIDSPSYLNEIFEIQIKTLLDEAWSKASHEFFYKTDEKLSWAKLRLMSQIKALLENAEIALSEAELLSKSSLLQKNDDQLDELNSIMEFYQKNWNKELLPKNLKRLVENTQNLLRYLSQDLNWLEDIIDSATATGKGSNIMNLSPYWIVVQSIIEEIGWELFLKTVNRKLKKGSNSKAFPIIWELEFPENINLNDYPNIKFI